MAHLVQILNPNTGTYTLADLDRGDVLRHSIEYQHGIPVAGTVSEPPSAPVFLSVLVWQDTRTAEELKTDLTPVDREIVAGKINVRDVTHYSPDESTDTPGTLVYLSNGIEIYVANAYDAFDRAFLTATGARVVEVG